MRALTINNAIKSIVAPGYVVPEISLVDIADRAGIHECRIGRFGGGVVTVPANSSNSFFIDLIDDILPDAEVLALPGTEVGSASGRQLASHIEVLSPPRLPRAFKSTGYQFPRKPKTRITCEHIGGCVTETHPTIMVISKHQKPKCQGEMESIFDYFGVQVSTVAPDCQPAMLRTLSWCSDEIRERAFFLFLQDGCSEATVLMSMIAYSAQYIDVHKQRLEAVHLLGVFEKDVQFRNHWTS
jgi:hypothetical protein